MAKSDRSITGFIIFVASVVAFGAAGLAGAADKSGEALFKQHCAACHPDGGNIMNPNKTLKKRDMAANKLLTEAAIVKFIRNPGPGMLKFDDKTLPEKDAKAVANYILKTYGK